MKRPGTAFTIAFLENGGFNVYGSDDEQVEPMDSQMLGKYLTGNAIKNATTLTVTYLEVNSGVVIIGGRPFYIP